MIHILPSELPPGLAALPDDGEGDAPLLEGEGLQEGLLLLLGLGELPPKLLLLLLLLEEPCMGSQDKG